MTLHVGAGTGLTSCLSVRLHEAIRHRAREGRFPAAIDSRAQFSRYRDHDDQDVSALLLGPYAPDDGVPRVAYDHGWQFRWYEDIRCADLHETAVNVCRPSAEVLKRAEDLRRTIGARTVVLYRGNDKATEIPKTPYEAMRDMAADAGARQFFVQTDEEEFLTYFRREFTDVVSFDDLPRIAADPRAFVLPERGHRARFALNYLATTVAIATARQLVTTTGNTGLWAVLYRGHTSGVWQYHGRHHAWRRL